MPRGHGGREDLEKRRIVGLVESVRSWFVGTILKHTTLPTLSTTTSSVPTNILLPDGRLGNVRLEFAWHQVNPRGPGKNL